MLLDPVDAAPWLAGADEPGQWAGSDPVLRDDPSTVVTGGAADPQLEPAVLWVVGNVDLIAHQYRDVPPPTVMDDGEVLCWQLDPDELPTVHLQKCPAAAIHWPHSDDRACRAPFELTTGPDTEGLGIADSPATPRRLDRASVAAWRRRAAELVVGPTLAAHLAARPPAPELLDLTPAPGGSEQQAWADTLLDSVVARQRLINHLQARQAADLSELERNYPGLVEFLPPEIGIALNVTENWASRQLDTARRIRLRLSRTWTGWDTGHLTADKAAFLADKPARCRCRWPPASNRECYHWHRSRRCPSSGQRSGAPSSPPTPAEQASVTTMRLPTGTSASSAATMVWPNSVITRQLPTCSCCGKR